MKKINFSDEEILNMEKILLGENNHFDKEEKVPIIKCMNKSISVMACPGSGKTTTLLAKIIMILNHLPLENNKGVCIITHTNVAINEIKIKLGVKSDILFQYPNFVGTIHSFFDKYLAIPYIKQKYNVNVASIDDDYYFVRMCQQKDLIDKLGKSLYGTLKAEIEKKEKSQYKIKLDYIKSIEMQYVNGKIQFSKGGRSIAKDPTTERYKLLYNLFVKKLFRQGILKYSDSYLLAQMYLEEHPMLTEYFSNRFRYVFMDEIQDNSKIQNEIINKVFKRDKIIIQKFGDVNQSIYSSDEEEEGQIEMEGITKYEISKSMRYTQEIADFINSLRVEQSEKNLNGIVKEKYILPHILIYEEDSIDKVKEKFVELITKYGLNNGKNKFKSCGWVGYKEKSEQLSIQSYFGEFIYNKSEKVKFKGISFTFILKENLKYGISVSAVYKSAIEFCVKYLNLYEFKLGDKSVNKTNLSNYLSEELPVVLNEYRKQIAIWAKLVLEYNDIAMQSIGNKTYELLQKIILIKEKDKFLKLFENLGGIESTNNKDTNKYIKDGIVVDIATVHGVKGETHTATLYLETYYNKLTDMQRILKYLVGEKRKKIKNDEIKSMKVAYVGMSRATDLLCVAIKKEHCVSYYDKLETMKNDGKIELISIF